MAASLPHFTCFVSSTLHSQQRRKARKERPNNLEFICMSSKRGFGDLLLDYIEGGPKLRKWYGAEDELLKVSNSMGEENTEDVHAEQHEENPNEVRDAVLVMDADSEIGQLIILHLVLKRVRIRALVRESQPIMTSFGSYVEPVVGDAMDKASIRKALKGVRAIVCPLKVGILCDCGIMRGVEHIVLLSQLAVYRSHRGLSALLNGKARQRAEEDEAAVSASGIPYTIIRAGLLQDKQSGIQGFNFQEGCASKGTISREDAAIICVEALSVPPQRALIFEVSNGQENVKDWKTLFESLQVSTSPT